MTQIGKWSFDNDPQILAERDRALTLARQQASIQRQHWEQGLGILAAQLDGLNTDRLTAQENAAAKRPLLDAARLKTQTNAEKVTQARLGLQSAQVSTSMARDALDSATAERGLRQKLLGQKLRGIQLQVDQLRQQGDLQQRTLAGGV